jgi:hypothetical protein
MKISLLPPYVSSNPSKFQICPHKNFRKTFSRYSQFSKIGFVSNVRVFVSSKRVSDFEKMKHSSLFWKIDSENCEYLKNVFRKIL